MTDLTTSVVTFLVLLGGLCSAEQRDPQAGDAPGGAAPQENGADRDGGVEELREAYAAAHKAWRQAVREAPDSKARRAVRAEDPLTTYYPRFEELANAGEPRATLWLIEYADKVGGSRQEKLDRRLALYQEFFSRASDCDLVLEGSQLLFKDSKLRRDSSLADLERLADLASAAADSEECRARVALGLGQRLAKSKVEATSQRGLDLLRKTLADHPDMEGAEAARDRLFVLEFLTVGCIAPDFEGETIDGETVRAKDYRGKVVVLDFFGFW